MGNNPFNDIRSKILMGKASGMGMFQLAINTHYLEREVSACFEDPNSIPGDRSNEDSRVH